MYCEFTVGDTGGGKEYKVNAAETDQECAKNVKLARPGATGATWNPSTKKCWAETGRNVDTSGIKASFLQFSLYQDCETIHMLHLS